MVFGRTRGGFRRPIQLSPWIRDQLADGSEYSGQALYGEYKGAMQAIPLARKRGKRRVMSYHSFMNYIYVLRRLSLIEYVRDAAGNIVEDEASDKGGNPAPQLHPARYFKAILSKIGDTAWEDIWAAYKAIT